MLLMVIGSSGAVDVVSLTKDTVPECTERVAKLANGVSGAAAGTLPHPSRINPRF